jgi:3-keto-disaccharide hydrolase
MTRQLSACVVFAAVSLPFSLVIAALAAVDTPSSLERDPSGWTDLLAEAGPGLSGWTRGSIPPGKPLSAESQWSLDSQSGTLLCRGDGGHDWLRWDKELSDFVYHVEWKFTPVEGKKGYNSGVYVRNSADAAVWHQAQTGDASGGYLFGGTMVEGKVKGFNLSKQLLENRVKPAGEWNTYEITCKGKDVTLWVNGAVTNEWHDCPVPRGYLGLEAEGWRIEFRNVKVKSL